MKTEEVKTLKAETVIEYAQLDAQIKKLEEQKKEDRERIIKLMKAGYESPEGLPYQLVLTNQERHPVSWKDEWMSLAKEHLGKFWKRKMKSIMDEVEVVNTPMLLVKVAAVDEENVVQMKKRGVA